MLKELDDYNWEEVFKYAEPSTFPGSKTSCAKFERGDVAELFGQVDGENDGDPWRAWGRLHDGRYFYIEAGCDYTGWG